MMLYVRVVQMRITACASEFNQLKLPGLVYFKHARSRTQLG